MNMNGAHQHLIVNHVPLFTLLIGTVVFAVSMRRKSADLRVLASVLFVLTGVSAWITVRTGGAAAHIMKLLGDGYRPFIREHAMAAVWAQRSGFLIALLAILMEWSFRKKPNWSRALQWILLIAAVHGCTVLTRVVYLGGLVRHTEIRTDEQIAVQQPSDD
jgi:hypothetical protein